MKFSIFFFSLLTISFSCTNQGDLGSKTGEEKKVKLTTTNYYQIIDRGNGLEKGWREKMVVDSFNSEEQLVKKTILESDSSESMVVVYSYNKDGSLRKALYSGLDSTVFTYKKQEDGSIMQSSCIYEVQSHLDRIEMLKLMAKNPEKYADKEEVKEKDEEVRQKNEYELDPVFIEINFSDTLKAVEPICNETLYRQVDNGLKLTTSDSGTYESVKINQDSFWVQKIGATAPGFLNMKNEKYFIERNIEYY